MSKRSFRRWTRRFEDEGDDGLLDRRLGRRSGRAVPDEAAAEVARLFRERYAGFTAKHFHEHLVRDHGFRWSYSWTKSYLQGRGDLLRAPRRGAHRRKRPRRPLVGMVLHQDGSSHAWLAGRAPLDLVITLDDATSTIYSAILVEQEGTASSFLGLGETIAAHGLPCSLYTYRGSHYFLTLKAGEPVDKSRLTQVGRALGQLGIEHIPAYSPEARGAASGRSGPCRTGCRRSWRWPGSERWRSPTPSCASATCRPTMPLRGRAERGGLRLRAGGRGAVARSPLRPGRQDRGARHTVSWNGRRLQIPPHPARAHFVKAKVRVHDYPDGGLAIFHGPRCLVRWSPDPHLRAAA